MARKKLSDGVIADRMVELRNLRRLHKQDQATKAVLRTEVKDLRELVAVLQEQNQTQAIQIAELQAMVFGKKSKPPASTPSPDLPKPRTKASYRRPLPPATAITDEVTVPLPETCRCGGSFVPDSITAHDRYEEDIPLPGLTPGYQPHLVTKYVIERGVCLACGKATSGKELGGAKVSLGPNVRLLTAHLISIAGMSYTQVTNLFLGLYGLTVSDGEIAGILRAKHAAWLPAYDQLKADIRGSPVKHYDETPWAIQDQGNYGHAWVMSAAGSPSTLFHLATSRGTRHARDLHGDAPCIGVHISDDYGVYRHLAGQQQLCWVHLYRVIRDLRYNQNLPEEHLSYVAWWYERFAAIYEDLRLYLTEPYDEVVRAIQANELWQRIQALVSQPAPPVGEPDKLTRLKAQLTRAGKDRLFVCLPKDTPCDNNRAERDLRQLVLKRKRSFGSKTHRGAQALATVLSICTTTWRSNPTGYFKQLALLG